jgi:hypothetical protein
MTRGGNQLSGDWFDEMYKEYEQKGGFDNLPGKGKPLSKETLEGDVLNNILKNANYIPAWLELQHVIRDAIAEVIHLSTKHTKTTLIEAKIVEINEDIKKYNNICPTALQKGLITLEDIKEQYERWK